MTLTDLLKRAGTPDDEIGAILAAFPRPDASRHNPDPTYLRSLLESAELSQRKCAAAFGINPRQVRHYFAGTMDCPYALQYALEVLAFLGSDTRIGAYERVVQAARATLAEQRREFGRGEFADLDELEDALSNFPEKVDKRESEGHHE